MSVGYYDPTKPGQENYVNSPYQYWKGVVEDKSVSYIEFAINGQLFTTQVNADGSWEYQLPLRLEEGGHNLTIRFFDRAGNAGIPFQTRLEVDLSPPDMPAIMRVLDDFGPVQGPVGNKGFTDDKTPAISGYAEPDSIVRLYSNGVLIGSVQAAKNGQWTITPELSDGEQRLYVTATDKFGQVSFDSPVYTLYVNSPRIDKPQLLEVFDNEGVNTGVIKAGSESDDRSPRLSGNAPLNAENVIIYVNGVRVGVAPVIDGQWRWESNVDLLGYGENTITTRAQNNRGELSDASEPFTYTVVPTAPVKIEYALDNFGPAQGKLENGALTDDFTPTLKGTAEANSIVYVYATRENGSWWLKGSTQADAFGHWQVEIARLDGGAGPYHFQASNSPTRDPAAPLFDLYVSDNGTRLKPIINMAHDNVGPEQGKLINGATTDDMAPTLQGKAEANSMVYIHARHIDGHWVVLGSVKADAWGNWITEVRALRGGYGTYEFQAAKTLDRDTSAEVFSLNMVPEKPGIVSAWDNFGAQTGVLHQGDVTDDLTPTLKGHAAANSVVYIYARHVNGVWVTLGSAVADAHGHWQSEVRALRGGFGKYEFQVSDSPVRDAAADVFDLTIISGKTEIISAWDDSGPKQGQLKSGDITDDMTPTLKGTSAPNKVVYIFGCHIEGHWVLMDSVTADATGNWSYQSYDRSPWKGLTQFQVSNSAIRDVNAPTFQLEINVDPAKVDHKGLVWNFNDGTQQGWIASGLYHKNDNIGVKRWSAGNSSYELGSMTNGSNTNGFKGEVVYRYIQVEAGKTYQFDFDGYRIPGGSLKPKIGLDVNGEKVIPNMGLDAAWNHFSGLYTASKTEVVRVAVTNEVNNGNGNDFAIDNIGVKEISRVRGQPDLVKDANGHPRYIDFKTGVSYTIDDSLKMTLIKGPNIGGEQKTLKHGEIIVGRGGQMKLDFDGVAEKVVLKSDYVHSKGNYIDFYDTQGKLLHSYELKAHPGTLRSDIVEYHAPAGKLIGSAVVRVNPAEVDSVNNPGGVRISDVEWGMHDDHVGITAFDVPAVITLGDEFAVSLSDMLAQGKQGSTIDMTGHGKNVLSVTVDDILQVGSQDLFVKDGKTQLLIKGDAQDVVKLDDILGDGGDVGDWVKQQGSTTVAGVKYQVYSHSGIDADVLIQEGVKTELV